MSDQTTPDAPPPAGPSPEGPAAPPARRRRTLRLALVAGLVAGLGVAAVGGYLFLRPYVSGEYPASLDTPQQVAGLERSTDSAMADAATEMSAALTGDTELDHVVAAFYRDPAAADRQVLLVGGTALIRDPAGTLDDWFQQLTEAGLPVSAASGVDAGPLGGTARCGEADLTGTPTSVCAWADHGSIVLAVFVDRPVDDSAALLRQVRSEILTR